MLRSIHSQRGVGMMEVLVSILIIAIAVLGFIALQLRATIATEEALKRSDALVILHGLAERIRLNSTGNYLIALPTTEPSCIEAQNCSQDQRAAVDLYQQQEIAESKGIVLGTANCANTSTDQPRLCLIAAWNETEPVIGADTVENRCLETTGKYANRADCLVLEAY